MNGRKCWAALFAAALSCWAIVVCYLYLTGTIH